MNYKKFTLLTIISSLVYILFHITTYNLLTKQIFGLKDKESVGDLARLSYRPEFINKRSLEYTLPKSHIYKQTFKDQTLDLVTIGDSFSYGGGFGKNPFYQDYLASEYGINVLNLGTKNISEYIEAVISLHNTGWLKKHKVKYLLLETVTRLSVNRLARKIDWQKKDKIIFRQKVKNIYQQDISVISTANYKVAYNYISHHLFHTKYNNGIYKFQLSKSLFTHPHNEILIYYSDISRLNLYNKHSIQMINKNLNKLAKILQKDNVKLIFMPVVDKYDLYYPYLRANTHQKNEFFPLMRKEKKDYIFINTKKILRPYINNGIKDIWYCDDTHWNYKASQTITKSKQFQKLFGEHK